MAIRTFSGNCPNIHESVFVDESAVIIGDVQIAEHVSVWPCAVIRGDVQKITIGGYSNIQDNSTLHVTHDSQYALGGNALRIGRYVTIAHGAVVHGCTIGNEVLIGMNATVLDKAHIEDQVIVGAGAVVSPDKTLESGYLYLGAPAKKIRKLHESEKTYLRYIAANYTKLKDQYIDNGNNCIEDNEH